MDLERELAEYLVSTRFEDLPSEAIDVMKNIVLGILGTTVAGATAEGVGGLLDLVREWGGKEEATILCHGDRIPAHNAAFVNGVMARAVDFCDVYIPPGTGACHAGALTIPAALAMAEALGGLNGREFLTALVVGTEVGARINAVSYYDGVEGTGVCGIFASTGIAGRMLGLSRAKMLHALGLALNRASGSLQNYVECTLAVRMVQGLAAQGGIVCAQLAQHGVTAPNDFLEGPFGYFHIFNRDRCDRQALIGDLGHRFQFTRVRFKTYPCCVGITAGIDAIFHLVEQTGLTARDVSRIDVTLPDHLWPIVGRPFELGSTPTVNAQFSIQYCLASALIRKSCRLEHFDEASIGDPEILDLVERIHVTNEPTLVTTVAVTTSSGQVHWEAVRAVQDPAGEQPTRDAHIARFRSCLDHAEHQGRRLPPHNALQIESLVNRLEDVDDVRVLIPLLVSNHLPLSCP